MTKPSKLEVLLLQFTLFFIPSNLAYHWISDQAFVGGKLVDYLMPKLYLSDIPLLTLISIWLLKSRKKIDIKKLINYKYFLLCAAFILGHSLFTSHYQASLWFFIKLAEMIVFLRYIQTYFALPRFLHAAHLPITISVATQSVIGIVQYINQKSIFGYLFMGETSLITSGNIAKSSLGGIIRIFPYGTTPHPNVLAGFLGISTLILLLCIQNNPKQYLKNILTFITIGLSIYVGVLTQSYAVFGAFIITCVMFIAKKQPSNILIRLIITLLVTSNLLVFLITIPKSYQSNSVIDSSSILRRCELIQIAKNELWDYNLVLGVGLNQFIPKMIAYPPVTAETAFLQPVHNVYLLWIVETGLIGLSGLLYGGFLLIKQLRVASISQVLPLICVLLIGSLDHYPLTLQTGQLLSTIVLSLAYLKQK